MTRNTAREIAAHLAYEWNFTDLPVGEFLDRRLAPECFAELAPECGLYADAPNAKQEQYIRRLVAGVADHAAELDDYIARYAQGWRFERIPLMASAVMRVAMYEILYICLLYTSHCPPHRRGCVPPPAWPLRRSGPPAPSGRPPRY